MFSAKKRIISRNSSRKSSRAKPKREKIKVPVMRSVSRANSHRKKTPPNKKYLIQKKRAELAERFGNRYVNSKRISKAKSRVASRQKPKVVKKSPAMGKYSGTIIYHGDKPLNPFKWKPDNQINQPPNYQWDSLLPGTHVLDKNTHITWIIEKNHKLSLAPCQTIHLDLDLPNDLERFNPGTCLTPFLPDITKIPSGTRFFFNNSPQCYQFNQNKILEPIYNKHDKKFHTKSNDSRLSQIIPIPVNSLGQQLIGLDQTIDQTFALQYSSDEGYWTLEDWLDGLIQGNSSSPGYLGELPSIDHLQVNDILDFYDPNIGYENQSFCFKLQVIMKHSQLYGREIHRPKQIDLNSSRPN